MPKINQRLCVEWGAADRASPGKSACGSLHVVKGFAGGTLAALVSGLGSTEEAAVTAETAAITLRRYAREPVRPLINRCHRNLLMSRGAVIGLASFNSSENLLCWLGVGNVRALLVRAGTGQNPAFERLVPYMGVVGYYIPVVHETRLPLQSGDTLIMANDGIGADFDQDLDAMQPPQALAESILEQSFQEADATVLVARYLKQNGKSD